MIILGIDPGLGTVGYGVLSTGVGGRSISSLGHGVITTPPGGETHIRLTEIYTDMCTLIRRFSPDAASVEDLYFISNVTTCIPVAEARGVILLALAQNKIPVFSYTPMQVKTAITGYGKATKRQMIDQVTLRLGLQSKPSPDDAADALAIAMCHAFSAAVSMGQTRRGI